MKRLKALGLAAVAAVALTALLGAGSASATVLCTTTTTPCGAAWHVEEIWISSQTSISAHSTGGALEATCSGTDMKATRRNTGSTTTTTSMEAPLESFTWGGCNETTDTLEGGELEIHTIAGTDNGTVTGKGFAITTVIAGISCVFTFGSGTDLGILTGGEPAILHLNAVVNKKSGSFLCPADSVWEGTSRIWNHTAVYVAGG